MEKIIKFNDIKETPVNLSNMQNTVVGVLLLGAMVAILVGFAIYLGDIQVMLGVLFQ